MKNRGDDKMMVLLAWAKALISMMLAGVVVYSIVAGVAVDAELLKVILALLAGYFGLSAKMYHSVGKGGGGGGWRG